MSHSAGRGEHSRNRPPPSPPLLFCYALAMPWLVLPPRMSLLVGATKSIRHASTDIGYAATRVGFGVSRGG
eukprot:877920-Rhodomonas_salina.1